MVYCRQPSIVEIQILRVGQFVVLCVPGELTTMAGRRLREAMQAQVPDFVIAICATGQVVPLGHLHRLCHGVN